MKVLHHPTIGRLNAIDWPYKFSKTTSWIRSFPPELGDHTDEILTELLGRSPEDVDNLRQEGVI